MGNTDLLDLLAWAEDNNGEQLIKKLMEWGALPKEGTMLCKQGHTLVLKNVYGDWWWTCRKQSSQKKGAPIKCEVRFSLRKGTFFARTQLTYREVAVFVLCWTLNMNRIAIHAMTRIG